MKNTLLLLLVTMFFPLNTANSQYLFGARHIHVGTTAGIYYGTGWLPYWGVNYGWPVYNFPSYGYSYYPYWNYAPRYSTFGAISYSPETGSTGVAWTYYSRQSAINASDNYCGAADCRPVVWVQGGCAALAASEENEGIGYGYHAYKYTSRSKAMLACKSTGAEDCKIVAWVCSY